MRPRESPIRGVNVSSAAEYGGVLRSVVLAAKRTGNGQLVEALGATVDLTTLSALAVVVPVPSGRKTRSVVGGNLAMQILRSAGVQPVEEALETSPMRGSQKSRTRASRAEDQRLRVRKQNRIRPGQSVVIFDDVVTTGSTIAAAARVLRAAGLDVVGAYAIARTVKRAQSVDQNLDNGQGAAAGVRALLHIHLRVKT